MSDSEFADLVKAFDERNAAAMVLLMAYSNFQDRLLLCLGSHPSSREARDRPSMLSLRRTLSESKMPKPLPSQVSALPKPTGKDLVEDDPDWTSLSYRPASRAVGATAGKANPVETFRSGTTLNEDCHTGFMRPSSIVWNQICLGYVPELATAWETVMRTNMPEMRAKMDRVFRISMFWVITRSIDCPYCMGHCEMNWEVAGLPKSLIAERSRLLAGDDWSSFPAEEQRAFAFARKLTQVPRVNHRPKISTHSNTISTRNVLFSF